LIIGKFKLFLRWDYLRRSGAMGYLLPLSGGADSSSSASIVRVMCGLAVAEAKEGNKEVINDINNILKKHPSASKLMISSSTNLTRFVENTTKKLILRHCLLSAPK
jgi:NH3-dependent NAD+ synthetase